jgi:hypothetical protein
MRHKFLKNAKIGGWRAEKLRFLVIIFFMNYDEIDVDKIVNEVSTAVAQGKYRKATKKESMEVRLAALALLVKNMQGEMHEIVQDEKESVHADGALSAL